MATELRLASPDKNRNKTFRSGRFGQGTFRSWSFRSRGISVRLWNLTW